VVDNAGVLTAAQREHLDAKLTQFQRSTSHQIALLIVPTLNGDDVDSAAVHTFEAWKIGKAGKDDGVLVLVAVQDHKVRIEVGYGLEGGITDALAGRIIRNVITPAFRQNDYAGGLDRAVDALIAAATGEDPGVPEDDEAENRVWVPPLWIFWAGIYMAFILLRAVSRRRRLGYWSGGAILADIFSSRGSGGSSGSGSSGSSWGSGGGGFSGGGGGRSGGGGASGSW
jgi:uncharacterized protein